MINIKEENLYVDRDENQKILDEAEGSNDRISALKLYCLMRFLSDDLFMCSWLMNIDKEMFRLLEIRKKTPLELNHVDTNEFVNVSVQTLDLLKKLIVKSGGIWNGKEQFVFLKTEE